MNGVSLCDSRFPNSLCRFHSSCSFVSSSAYLILPRFTASNVISFSPRIRRCFGAVLDKGSYRFRCFAVNKRISGGSELLKSDGIEEDGEYEDDDEDWDDFDVDAEGDEDEHEGVVLPLDKMKKWLESKPRGFGIGKTYDTSVEDKLLDEIEQSWKAQAANLNKLKNDPAKQQPKQDDNGIKGSGETQIGFRVRVSNLPKKKNVHRDLKSAFKEVSGMLSFTPAVSGNKKTKDPVCKGFAFVEFKTEIDANRFVEQFTGQRLSFGKVIKQIKCQIVEFSSNQSESEGEYSDIDFQEQELPFSESEVVSNACLDPQAELDECGYSDKEVKEMKLVDVFLDPSNEVNKVEEDEQNHISSSTETPIELRHDSKTDKTSRKQAVQRDIREYDESDTSLVSFKTEKAEADTIRDDELDKADVEENPEPAWADESSNEDLKSLNSSTLSSEEKKVERIRMLEHKLLGKGKLWDGVKSDTPEPKSGKEEAKKKEKKKKKKILAKKGAKLEIPGSSLKRLKVKEKALLSGVLSKYAAKAASNLK